MKCQTRTIKSDTAMIAKTAHSHEEPCEVMCWSEPEGGLTLIASFPAIVRCLGDVKFRSR